MLLYKAVLQYEYSRNCCYKKEKNESQQAIADQIGITRQYYNYIERGLRNPSVKTAKRIAKVLGFHWTLFFEESNNKTKN